MEPARGSWLPWKHMHFSICRKRSSFDWLCTPVLCPTTGFGVTTDCSKHPEKPSLSVVGSSGGDGFCDLAGGLIAEVVDEPCFEQACPISAHLTRRKKKSEKYGINITKPNGKI